MSEINTIDRLGETVAISKIIDRSIDEFIDDTLKTIGSSAFSHCPQLRYVSFPAVTSCPSNNTFSHNPQLASVELPAVTAIGENTFAMCTGLIRVEFPSISTIGQRSFSGCSALTTVILGNTSQVVTLNNRNAFDNATNAIIYVPDALVDSYKSATNWSTYASRIKGISELPA